ncbi:MAG TPA: phosphoribosylglycinamide formyltransferase [Opitutales bacterium]|nr:phosphoribosylglycinamide formyltransferase [Opitutales bacterium]
MPSPFNIVLLGSGRGSNAEAVLAAQQAGILGRAHVAGILCDQPGARILELGPRFNVPALYLDPAPYKTKLEGVAEQNYIAQIRAWNADLVVLAGFMRVLKANFLHAFAGRIINLHPSLLPAFPGLESIRQALDARAAVTGCTVHEVNATVDGGKILRQAQVPITPGDTLETLATKVHTAEHALLPGVIADISEGRLALSGHHD